MRQQSPIPATGTEPDLKQRYVELKTSQRLVYPLPNSGLCCRCKQAANRTFHDVPKGTPSLVYKYGIWVPGEFHLKGSNLGFRPQLLSGIKVQFIEVLG